VATLFAAAYTCNLVAAPLDDQLTFEHARDPAFWAAGPLPPAFKRRLGAWHALNLARAGACGAAWALACYRASPRVVLAAAAAAAAARGGGFGAADGGFGGRLPGSSLRPGLGGRSGGPLAGVAGG
jgi:hypothetical protein